MTKEITAEDFFYDFLNATNDNNIKMDVYKKSSQYTKTITDVLKKILTENYGLKVNNEYYRIDVFGWTRIQDEELKAPEGLAEHLWQPQVAIEHENDHTDWTDELTKLLFINCKLKVIIAYNHWDTRDDKKLGDKTKLAYASKVISKLAQNDNLNCKYLIIFGNCWGIKCGNGYDKKNYKGYVFTNGEFIELKNQSPEN